MKKLLLLFWEFFKIGLFTFGGGYAMIGVMQRELVEKKNYISNDDFLDLIGIAESTPGPLAINSATYIGYKTKGVLGSLFATIGVVLPSFIIITIISLVFDAFYQLEYVKYAFMGIQACVAFIILNAGIKMLKHLKKNVFTITLLISTILLMIVLTLFARKISSIIFILAGGLVGVIIYLVTLNKGKDKINKESKAETENSKGDDKND
ncbi:MAG: chromate transporter [Clostridia bacterium]|nr:chromate transporter [Clostridia bacterium]